jgi:GDPmannose 4,6-dehydratase
LSDCRSIVVGHRGQDGRILLGRLRQRMDRVYGIDRGVIEDLGYDSGLENPFSLANADKISQLLHRLQPDEIYYLAAYHRSSQGFSSFDRLGSDLHEGMEVNVQGVVNFLEGMRLHAPRARLFYASSSLVFGEGALNDQQNEMTPWKPTCEYGLMKALGMQACRLYRNSCGLFASCGILYNHESIYRTEEFLSKKVISAAHHIRAGTGEKLVVGDLDAVVDWSYAPDFVDAFLRILQLDKPDDYILASGEGHTVREFIEIAFSYLGLDWRDHVVEIPQVLHRSKSARIGDPSRLKDATGWAPSLRFADMVRRLVDEVNPESFWADNMVRGSIT